MPHTQVVPQVSKRVRCADTADYGARMSGAGREGLSFVGALVPSFERRAELVFLGQGETGGERLHAAGAGGFGK